MLAISAVASYAATICISLGLYYVLGSAGATIEDLLFTGGLPPPLPLLYRGLLYAMPRLDLFNISRAVLHQSAPQPWIIVLPFVAYAACCSAFFLALGAAAMKKKDL